MNFSKSYGTTYAESRFLKEDATLKATTLPASFMKALEKELSEADEKLKGELDQCRKDYHAALSGQKVTEKSDEPVANVKCEKINQITSQGDTTKLNRQSDIQDNGDLDGLLDNAQKNAKKELTAGEKTTIESDYVRKKNFACKMFRESMQDCIKNLVNQLVEQHSVFKLASGQEIGISGAPSESKEEQNSRQTTKSATSPDNTVKTLLELRNKANIFDLATEFKNTADLTKLDYKKLYTNHAKTFMEYEDKETSKQEQQYEWGDDQHEVKISLMPVWINSKLSDHSTTNHQNALFNHSCNILSGSKAILDALTTYADRIALNIEENHNLKNEKQEPQTFHKTLFVVLAAAIAQVFALKFSTLLGAAYAFSGIAVCISISSASHYKTQAGFETIKEIKINKNAESQQPIWATMHNALCKTILQTRESLDLMLNELPVNIVGEELRSTASRVTGDGQVNSIAEKLGIFGSGEHSL